MRRMNPVIFVALLSVSGLAGALNPTPALAQPATPAVNSEVYPLNQKSSVEAQSAALKAQSSRDDIVNRVVLPPVVGERRLTPASKGAPQQVGFRRSISLVEAQEVAAARLQWKPVDRGTVAVFSVTSPDAAALRVAFAFQSLPDGTEIRFFSLGADRRVFGPFALDDIRNVEVKDDAGGPSVFWSPVIEGDTAGVEIFVPVAAQKEDVRFTLQDVSHLVASAMNTEAFLDKASGWCEVNVACYSSTWGSTANAVAKILFTKSGITYMCTGTLLNDADTSTYRPYFLTANHCLSTSSVAATVNSWWFYQSSCGGTSGSALQLYRGATLLATSTTNDFTFLVLNDPAPGGVTLAGWTAADPVGGAGGAGIHHPVGDVKKISFGTVHGISSYGGYVNGFGSHLYTTWYQGVTEGGSSGSPLFNATHQVVGQLHGGYSSCSYPWEPDYYGRFSLTYPYVRQWLASPAVSLTSSVAFPVTAGGSVTWTATGAGGTAPYTYQFWLFDGAAWSMVRDWSASNTWTWLPSWPGGYSVQVWMRNAGSSSGYDAFGSGAASIATPSVLTVTAITPSPVSAAAGTSVTWTATALGGPGPYTYKFYVHDGAGWTLGRDWSPSNAWAWTPPAAGTYSFQVWVRNAGSVAGLDAWRSFGPYTAGRPSSVTVTAFAPDLAAPKPAGTPVRWTATVAGGTGPYTYKFYLHDGASWSVGQDWSGANAWTWTPPNAGSYALQVWVRNAASTAPSDAWLGNSYTVTGAVPLSVTSLVPDRVSPVAAGTPVLWTAGAIGGTGPYTYKFWVWDGSAWSMGRDWGEKGWQWIPPAPGTYSVQAWARNAGSATSFDGWLGAGPVAVSIGAPLSVTSLTVAPASPLVVGGPAVVSVTATGGAGPYTYQFWVFNGTSSTWSVARGWSAVGTFTWVPPTAGSYSIQAWVRNAGSVTALDAWAAVESLTVNP